MEGVTANVVQRAIEVELEAEPGDVNDLLQSHEETLMKKKLHIMDEKRKWFLEMETTPGEHAEKTVEMTTKCLEWYLRLVPKAVQG